MAVDREVKTFFTMRQMAGVMALAGERFLPQLGSKWEARTTRISEELVGGSFSIWNGHDSFVLDCDETKCRLSKFVLDVKNGGNGFGAGFLWGCTSRRPSVNYYYEYYGDMGIAEVAQDAAQDSVLEGDASGDICEIQKDVCLECSDNTDDAGRRPAEEVTTPDIPVQDIHIGFCGDGTVDEGEECDDGKNGDDCDGCLDTCKTYVNTCGDKFVCGDEECDDGKNGDDCDGCLDTCKTYTSVCGDALVCGDEECDDGKNGDDCDGCLDTCKTYVNTCGDGIVCAPEECDDGKNGNNCDGCLDTCKTHTNVCGDKIVCAPEKCDDGNTKNIDGCSSKCEPEDAAMMEICKRWNSDRADMSEGSWSGNASSCTAGDISAAGRANALKIANLYRWLAKMPPTSTDPTYNSHDQKCALMMHANDALSHKPPSSWLCYTADGALGASNSNLVTTPAVEGMDYYMVDNGNETTIGHRRWMLSHGLSKIGIGSTSEASCMWVVHQIPAGAPAWTAWPSPGYFPVEAVRPFEVKYPYQSYKKMTVDHVGWTVQSETIDLSSAKVTVTDGGANMPVDTVVLAQWYGSKYAINFIPKGWLSTAGHTYKVSVGNVSSPFSYSVKMVACTP